jgi:hypothetical protein
MDGVGIYMAERRKQGTICKVTAEDVAMLKAKHGGSPHCTFFDQAKGMKCYVAPRWDARSYRPNTTGGVTPSQEFLCDGHGRQFAEDEALPFPP